MMALKRAAACSWYGGDEDRCLLKRAGAHSWYGCNEDRCLL
jgi:hypothetical protein